MRNSFKILQSMLDDIVISFNVMMDASIFTAQSKTSEVVPAYNGTLGDQCKQQTLLQSLTIADITENHPLFYAFDKTLITRIDYKEVCVLGFEPETIEMNFVIDQSEPDTEYHMGRPIWTIRIKHLGDFASHNSTKNYSMEIMSGDHAVDMGATEHPLCMNDGLIGLISKAKDRIDNLNIIFNKVRDAVRFPSGEMESRNYAYLKAFFDKSWSGHVARRFFYQALSKVSNQSSVAAIVKGTQAMDNLIAKYPNVNGEVKLTRGQAGEFSNEIVAYLNRNGIGIGYFDDMIANALKDTFTPDVKVDSSVLENL